LEAYLAMHRGRTTNSTVFELVYYIYAFHDSLFRLIYIIFYWNVCEEDFVGVRSDPDNDFVYRV